MKRFYRTAACLTAAALLGTSLPLSALAAEKGSEIGVADVVFSEDGMSYSVENLPEDESAVMSVDIEKTGSSQGDSSLPESFSLADSGLTTSVKNQFDTNACWAFSTISCIEQNLILKGLENSSVDFSEAAMAWFGCNTKVGSGDGETVENPFDDGGNWLMAALELSRFSGLEYEDYEPYFGSNTDAMVISENQRNVCEYHLKSAVSYSANDKDKIKQAVAEKGGVSVSYFNADGYFSEDNESYYNPDALSVNHAVTIVGWDDSYSRNNFNSENQPENDGAWLVKGSWGDFSGDGYYYISYEEPELKYFCSFDMEESSAADSVYTYTNGTSMVLTYAKNSITGGNVFTAADNEVLKDISFVAMNTEGNDVKYTIDVYTDLQSGSPVGSTKLATVSGTISNDGYYAIDIPSEPSLTKGKKYSAVVTLEYSGEYSYLTCEGSGAASTSNTGESFVLNNGSWYDCKASKYNNIYINAYTSSKSAVSNSTLTNLVSKYSGTVGVDKELQNAQKVLNDENASAADVKNARLLLQAAVENADTVVTISNISDWNSFAQQVANGDNMSDKIVLLESDLDFSGQDFIPVGGDSGSFDGCFDGNGHIISGIDYISENEYCGLFREVTANGRVKNVVVRDSSFSGATVGGLVGKFAGQTLKNCGFVGTLDGSNISGGLVGLSVSGNVESCYTSVKSVGSGSHNDFFGNSDAALTTLASNLITADSFSETAYLLNTVGGSQHSSDLWTSDGESAIFTEYDKSPSYKVTFDVLGNSFVRYTDSDGKTNFPKASLQEGYELRWFCDGEEITSEYSFKADTANVAAKAVKLDSFTVTYVLNGGENSTKNPDFITADETVTLAAPTMTGATFIGWYTDEEFYGLPVTTLSDVSENTVLYARWDTNKYKVIFLDIDGNEISSQAVKYGQSATAPDAPTVKGMLFEGWDKDFSNITENLTVSAIYKAYTVHRSISDCVLAPISDVTYSGSKNTLSDTFLFYDGEALTLGKDFTLTYSDNVNAGIVKATITGIGDYYGSRTVNFTINPKAGSLLTVSSVSTMAYTGSAVKPTPTVKDGNKVLKNGTDYTLSYSRNTNIGTAYVVINFKGNYYGSKEIAFKIKARSASYVTVGSVSSKTYTGKNITLSPTVKDGTKTLVKGTDYTLSYKNNCNAGTAQIVLNFMGNYTGSKTVSFTIKKCAASKVTFGSVSKKVYTGKQIKPTPSIKYNGNKLVKDTDFKVTYENNIKTGKATISVRLIGNYSGSKTLYFNIIPKQVTVSSVKKSASGKFKATWKTVNCTGYQISYSTSSSFKSSKSVTVTSSSAKSKTVSGLKKGKTYYVRVRAYVKIGGTKYYGSYSKTVKVKV